MRPAQSGWRHGASDTALPPFRHRAFTLPYLTPLLPARWRTIKNRGGIRANKETLGTTRALRSHLANKINGVRGGRRGERKTQKRRGGVHQRPSTQFPAAGQWSLIAAQAQLNTNICVCNPQLKQHNSDGSLSCFGRGLRHQLPFVLK